MIFSRTLLQHVEHVRHVIILVAKHGLKIRIKKCKLAKSQVALLGHIVNKNGVPAYPKKTEVILSTPRPSTKRICEAFSE